MPYEKIDARIAGSWWEGYHNPGVEALIDQGRATTDDADRAAIYARADTLMQAGPPWLTLCNPRKITGLLITNATILTMNPARCVIERAALSGAAR